jgi:hypothetical protein
MKMKHLGYTAVALLALSLPGCGKKEEEVEGVPAGFCKTESECQPTADRQNQTQEQLRQDLVGQGVHEQYLPCGKYKTTKAPNGFWRVTRDTVGCPPTASQQDPHPDLGKAKKSAH